MHHNHFEALQLVQKLSYLITADDYDAVDVSVHPPFTDLRTVQTYFISEKEPIPIALGAQHCHSEEKGAFTGEVSAAMLAKLDVRVRDRRPLRAPGAVRRDRRAGERQGAGHPQGGHDADPLLRGDPRRARGRHHGGEGDGPGRGRPGRGDAASRSAGLVVAYEPIWAIGTGRTASSEDAQAVCSLVRSVVARIAGAEAAASVRIQYGGSVKPTNAAELMAQPDIDGALVGGASLDADDFARIVQYRL